MTVTLPQNSSTSKSAAEAQVIAKTTAVWIKYGLCNIYPLDVKKVKGGCFHTKVFWMSMSSSVKPTFRN